MRLLLGLLMALTFVGSAEASGADVSFNITMPGGIAQGDYACVNSSFVGTADGDPGVSTAGFTELAELYANDTRDCNLSVSRKIMGSTPDSTVACNGSGVATSGAAAVAHVWRGVDSVTPEDATTTTATGINASVPDSPSITTVTSNAVVLAVGAGTQINVDNTVTAPAGYINQVDRSTDIGDEIIVGMASKLVASPGAEDPALWTAWSTNTAESWGAATIALRPSLAGDLATTNANDTSAASGKVVGKGTLATTNAADTMTASGKVGSFGTMAVTNAADTMAASGKVVVKGTLARTNANDVMSATGEILVFPAFLRDIDAERCWLLELDAFPLAPIDSLSSAFGEGGFGEMAFGEDDDGAAGGVTTLYHSSHGYTSQPADTPASINYDSRLVGDVQVRRDIAGRDWVGGLTECRAQCELNNADGALDRLPETYALDGRAAKILVGRLDASRADFGLVFSGVTARVEPGAKLFRLYFSDARARLEVPLSATTYAGTGGNEGGADLKGKPKPKAWGATYNVPAPLVDSANLIYQVHGGAINDVPAAYDRGVALVKVGGAPAAGQYQVTAATGTLKLGATPAGTVTADVLGDASGAGYVNKTGDIANRILLNEASLDASEIDAVTLAQLNIDAPAEVGDWTGPEPRAVADALEVLLAGVGAFGGFSRLGKFTFGVIAAPGGASAASYTEEDILELERIPLPQGIDPIVWRVRVAWQRNYTVQTDLAAAVTAARRTFAAQAERVSESGDATLRSRRILAREYGPTGNRFAQQADADTETARLRTLWGVERGFYKVKLPAIALERDLGQVVTITHSRFGFAAGKQARILGHEVGGPYVTLTVLA